MTSEILEYIVHASDTELKKLQKTVAETNAELAAGTGKASAAASSSLDRYAARAAVAGKNLTKFVTLPVLGVGVAAGKMALDFDESMTKVESLVGVSRKQIDQWKAQLLKLGPAVGKSPKELADALFFVASAGFKGNDAIKVLTASAKASASGLGPVKTVADAVTSAVNAYGKSNLTASGATDVLVNTVKKGKVPTDELTQTLGKVIPIAAAMHVGFDEVGGALASMSRLGTNAAEGTTALRAVLAGFLKPTKQTADGLMDIGTSAGEVRKELADKGLLATLLDLKAKTHGNLDEFAKLVPNIRGLAGALGLTGANAKDNAKIFDQLSHSSGATNEAFKITSQDGAQKLHVAMASFQAAMIQIGEKVVPVFAKIATLISGAFNAFDDLPAPVKKAAGEFILFLAILGPVLLIAVKLEKAIIALKESQLIAAVATKVWTAAQWLLNAALDANPIAIVIIALAALVAGIIIAYQHSETFRKIVKEAFDAVKGAANAVLDFFRQHWPEIAVLILGPFAPLVLIAGNAFGIRDKLVGAFNAVKDFVRQHWPEIATLISGPFAPLVLLATGAFGVRAALEGAIKAVKSFVEEKIGDIVDFFRNLPGRISTVFTAAWKAIVDDLHGPVLTLKGWFKDRIDDIVTFWERFPGRVGRALVDAAEEGEKLIKKALHKLFSVLPGFVKDILGIDSPSKVFAEIGDAIIMGVVHGIERSSGKLLSAAKDKAFGALGAIGGFLGGGGGGGTKTPGQSAPGGTAGGSGGWHASPQAAQAFAAQLMKSYGWGSLSQFRDLVTLWNNESGWSWHADNPNSDAYGIPQALPGSKMASIAGDWHDNAFTQVKWGLDYIRKYGSPSAALAFWNRTDPRPFPGHWYATGGITTRPTLGMIGEHGREAVLPLESALGRRALAGALRDALQGLAGSSPVQYVENQHINNGLDAELAAAAISRRIAIAG